MRTTNTKERIIEVALELFSEKGYEETKMEDIAKAVGIKAPSIYDHFKGKKGILQAVVTYADEEYEKGMAFRKASADQTHSGEELKEYAMRAVNFTLNNDTARKMRKIIAVEQFRNEEFNESATRHFVTNHETIYAELFAKLIDEGLMINGNSKIYALEFIAPVTLLVQISDRNPDRKDEVLKTIEEHMDTFVERYFR